MKNLVYIFICVCVVCSSMLTLYSCEEEQTDILSSGKMEDVLYDYYIAQGTLDQQPQSEREKNAQAYIDAVFRKHDITEAEFDSSLLYYNRNPKVLGHIYANLEERFTEANEEFQKEGGSNEMIVLSENGDTTNIWTGSSMLVLRPSAHLNYKSFVFKADSSFKRKDTYILQFGSVFAKENPSDRNCRLHAGISVTYKNGKTIGSNTQCTVTMPISLRLYAEDKEDIESVNVFFYYAGSKETRNLTLVKDLLLIRMHSQEKEEVETDSIKKDSVSVDTIANKREKVRLTPEELREQNQGEEKIKIKAAPDVRTPNSFGTRRRQPARQARPNK